LSEIFRSARARSARIFLWVIHEQVLVKGTSSDMLP
jgi:hypothetical protein